MQNQMTIIRIPLDKLLPHPENPNRMAKQTFEKLKRHIKQSHNYEPLIVRNHPEIENCFEIINGHHRADALRQIGETFADCCLWNVDDDQTRVLLATLNRLGGKDQLAAKLSLIKNLSEKYSASELAKWLPDTKSAIEKLKDITKPLLTVGDSKLFLNTLVFLLDDNQIKIVELAIKKAMKTQQSLKRERQEGKSQKMSNALTIISENYLKQQGGNYET